MVHTVVLGLQFDGWGTLWTVAAPDAIEEETPQRNRRARRARRWAATEGFHGREHDGIVTMIKDKLRNN